MVGRLGVGATNQMDTGFQAISFKVLRAPTFGMGGVIGLSTSGDTGGHAAGLKFYRVFFEEPQLNFYGAVLGGLIKKKGGSDAGNGFQFDFTLGSEFAFVGLDSIGFSFEFGLSMRKLDEFTMQTAGYHFVTSAVHFYL
jgi:hypothetical protein